MSFQSCLPIRLTEKEIECDVVFVNDTQAEETVAELNPYAETPTLADRDLVLYDGMVVNEYLDERSRIRH